MAFGEAGDRRAAIEFGKAPDDFDMEPFDIGDRDAWALSDRGLCFWLSDAQVDLTGSEKVFTSRVIQQVTGSEGLQPSASFEVSFNPQHERVVIHAIQVRRDLVTRDATNPEAFEFLRRELNLERAMYDGRLTAHMIIPDVRVGDVVETAYSVIGSNPVLKGTFSHFITMGWAVPTIETRFRIIAPSSRDLVVRNFGNVVEREETLREATRIWTWQVVDAEPYRHDPNVPAWWIGYPSFHVADALGWQDVSDLFRDGYAPSLELPAELESEIADIGRQFPEMADRAAECLRYVQGLLRYHSIGLGDGGYRPRPISAIWETRYGDCKDASRLLVAVLNRLDIEACPALVHTQTGAGLNEALPVATAFDHCIVKVKIAGQAYWLDPTGFPQAGGLEALVGADHHWALPLVENATLEPIKSQPLDINREVFETWNFAKSIEEGATLAVRTLFRGARADDMRRWRDNDGIVTVSRRMREQLEETHGELIEREQMIWNDNSSKNFLELIENYTVLRPFSATDDEGKWVKFSTQDNTIGPMLRVIETGRRKDPIDLGKPRRLRTTTVFNFPVKVQIVPWSFSLAGPGIEGISSFDWLSERKGRLILALDIRDRVVSVEHAARYFAFSRRMREMNGITFSMTAKDGQLKDVDGQGSTWVSWAVLAVAVLGLAIWRVVSQPT